MEIFPCHTHNKWIKKNIYQLEDEINRKPLNNWIEKFLIVLKCREKCIIGRFWLLDITYGIMSMSQANNQKKNF